MEGRRDGRMIQLKGGERYREVNRIRKGPLKGWENQAQKEEVRRAREDSSPRLDIHVWRE